MQNEQMEYGDDYKTIPATSVKSKNGVEVTDDLYCYTVQIVNVVFYGKPESDEFVLIDTGMPNSADSIISETEERFGKNCRPKAIILTHGHFDHVGSVIELIRHWNIQVYAHPLEFPFLTGKKAYPKPDTKVEGGMLAKLSSQYPVEPINIENNLQEIPSNGGVPSMPDFQWIHTPGHTPGHISLFRERDRSLLAGDAFVTVKQESLFKVISQKVEINGPPRYLTPDWISAKNSVKKLQSLEPSLAITGHGKPVSGSKLSSGLRRLADEFDEIAVPDYGKFVENR